MEPSKPQQNPRTSKRPPLPPSQARKRKASEHVVDAQNHFKLRALVKSLRPHFIQVLRTPDFRNGKAAHEILKQMKLVMDVYKQMAAVAASTGMPKKPSTGMSLPSENKDEVPSGVSGGFEKSENARLQGTYVVGGSNFGWNFIIYPSSKAVYYGATKESHRLKREKARKPA